MGRRARFASVRVRGACGPASRPVGGRQVRSRQVPGLTPGLILLVARATFQSDVKPVFLAPNPPPSFPRRFPARLASPCRGVRRISLLHGRVGGRCRRAASLPASRSVVRSGPQSGRAPRRRGVPCGDPGFGSHLGARGPVHLPNRLHRCDPGPHLDAPFRGAASRGFGGRPLGSGGGTPAPTHPPVAHSSLAHRAPSALSSNPPIANPSRPAAARLAAGVAARRPAHNRCVKCVGYSRSVTRITMNCHTSSTRPVTHRAAALPGLLLILLLALPSALLSQDRWSSGGPAGHSPIGVMGDHTHGEGEWMLSYMFARESSSGLRDGTPRADRGRLAELPHGSPHHGPWTCTCPMSCTRRRTRDPHADGHVDGTPHDRAHGERPHGRAWWAWYGRAAAGTRRLSHMEHSVTGWADAELSALVKSSTATASGFISIWALGSPPEAHRPKTTGSSKSMPTRLSHAAGIGELGGTPGCDLPSADRPGLVGRAGSGRAPPERE
jgi:hypothetical protein